MDTTTFKRIQNILTEKFSVPAETIRPEAPLESLGLDSLSVMTENGTVHLRGKVRSLHDKRSPRRRLRQRLVSRTSTASSRSCPDDASFVW